MAPPKPQSTLSIIDGGMGISSGDVVGKSAKIGVCSGGVAGTTYSYSGTDPQNVIDELGVGPLVDATIKHLLRSGGKPVLAHKATSSTVGSSSAVTNSGGGPTVTLTGAPYDQGEGIAVITLGGVIGTSRFKFSLDGGDTYSEEYATAATFLLPNNVTLNMAAGTYVVNSTYSWTDTAPAMTLTNTTDGFDALLLLADDFEFVHVVGQPASAAAAATLAAALQTKVEAAHAAHKYIFAIMEMPVDTPANLIAAMSTVSAKYVSAAAGYCELINDRSGSLIQKRSIGRVYVPRIARNPIDIHPMRDVADSTIDPHSDVVKLVPVGAASSTGYYDEDKTGSLNDQRFTTMRSIVGIEGFYLTNGLMLASAGSDFEHVMRVRIICAAARAYYAWSLRNLARRLRKVRATGFILPSVADGLESDARNAIAAAIGFAVDGIAVKINRADDLAADPTVRAKIRVIGPDWALEYESELGFASSLPDAA
ncbi:MAG: DUF2586 family protein [Alsobacter sp.]